MTGRDRIVVIGISVLLVFGLTWLLVVSPERKQAAKLNEQVAAESVQLATANSQEASARGAQAQYDAAYASIVRLGKAVPPSEEVPSLIFQLAQASHERNVEFSSIVSGANGGSSSSGGGAAAPAAISGFTPMPFTFTFNGTFVDLYHLFQQLDRATVVTSSGGLVVSGRLLTIQTVKLAPLHGAGAGQGSTKGSGKRQSEELSGTITATAYVLPGTQGLTAGATASAPAGVASPSATAAASTPHAASSPTAPAVARVNP
jgi:Type II secretion system (T2SS), protein M